MEKPNAVLPHNETSLSLKRREARTLLPRGQTWRPGAHSAQGEKDTRRGVPWMGKVQNRHSHREWVPGCQGVGVTAHVDGAAFWGEETSGIRGDGCTT